MRPFRLHWAPDDSRGAKDTPSIATVFGIRYVDIVIPKGQRAPLRFNFYRPEAQRWDGKDFQVEIKQETISCRSE